MTGGKLNPTYVKGGGVVSAERNSRSFQIRAQLTTHPCFQCKEVKEIGFFQVFQVLRHTGLSIHQCMHTLWKTILSYLLSDSFPSIDSVSPLISLFVSSPSISSPLYPVSYVPFNSQPTFSELFKQASSLFFFPPLYLSFWNISQR